MSIILHFGAGREELTYGGRTYNLSGLSLRDRATIRYNAISAMFGKAAADDMVATYEKDAA
jgi:hypothetical protein